MPHRTGNPVSIFTTLHQHPLQFAFSLSFMLSGLALLWVEMSPSHQHLTTMQSLPFPLLVLWSLMLLLAGVCMSVGLLWPRSPHVGRTIEKVGLVLAVTVCLVYAHTLKVNTQIIPTFIISTTLAFGFLGRYMALWLYEKQLCGEKPGLGPLIAGWLRIHRGGRD